MEMLYLVFIGIGAGVLAGLFGIGGGIVIVPALVLLMGMPQHTATGTSLVALLLPVGILGVWNYYHSGTITSQHIKYGLIVALGLFTGTFFGSKIALNLSRETLERAFAIFLIILSVYILFFRKP
ncbi:MAG: sulfite exporter TauE/SafE family protein [Ignavibacteriae bacterium]|nr:sulfite exporter TauE/SafE family protein [Ignavibacteriota bacterium]